MVLRRPARERGTLAGAILRPLRDGEPLQDAIETKTYLAMQGAGDETFAWGNRVYTKGGFLDELSDEFLDVAVDHITRPPRPGERRSVGPGRSGRPRARGRHRVHRAFRGVLGRSGSAVDRAQA